MTNEELDIAIAEAVGEWRDAGSKKDGLETMMKL